MSLGDNKYSGKQVAEYIRAITPYEDDIPETWLTKYVEPNEFELKVIPIEVLLDDPDFAEGLESFTPRYEYDSYGEYYTDSEGTPVDTVTKETLYEPVVLVDKMLIDGYSRAGTLLFNGEETIEAFVKL